MHGRERVFQVCTDTLWLAPGNYYKERDFSFTVRSEAKKMIQGGA